MKIDMTGADKEKGKKGVFQIPDEGTYVVKVAWAEEALSSGMVPQLKLELETVRRLDKNVDSFGTFREWITFTEKCKDWNAHRLACMGFEADGEAELDVRKLKGAKFVCTITHEEYNGYTNARSNKWLTIEDWKAEAEDARKAEEIAADPYMGVAEDDIPF